jgi:hypothetical protein
MSRVEPLVMDDNVLAFPRVVGAAPHILDVFVIQLVRRFDIFFYPSGVLFEGGNSRHQIFEDEKA